MQPNVAKPGAARVPPIAKLLGGAGLLPFLGGAAMAAVASGQAAALAASGLIAYALAITCFLCGAWWGIALLRRAPALLLASNAIVVAAWAAAWLLQPDTALTVLAALLAVTAGVEARYWAFAAQPAYYRRMRLRLTVVATACLLAAAGLS